MNLVELGRGVFAFVDPTGRFGYSNVGLVIDGDGLTVIDTTATPERGFVVRQEILALTAELELPIKRVVLSSSRIAFSGGGQPFWAAAFFGTDATSDQLDAPPNPLAFRRLLPDFSESYFDEFTTRPVTHTVSESAYLTPSSLAVPLGGEASQNLVVSVESAGVVFAGALGSFGVTPLLYDGDPRTWIDSLNQLGDLGSTVVPGHGPPGGTADVGDLVGYMQAVIDADGDVNALAVGPWDRWADRRFDAVNVERAAALSRGIDQVPQAMFALLGFD